MRTAFGCSERNILAILMRQAFASCGICSRLIRVFGGLCQTFGASMEKKALPCEWPDDLDLSGTPELVRELAARGLWLEQE